MRPVIDDPEFDVVIIGSGVAGALAGYRLAQNRARVLVLEAGGVVQFSRATCHGQQLCNLAFQVT